MAFIGTLEITGPEARDVVLPRLKGLLADTGCQVRVRPFDPCDPEVLAAHIGEFERELQATRARLDATTRGVLWVEAVDRDDELALVRAMSLDAAHGVARRNREDCELGDGF